MVVQFPSWEREFQRNLASTNVDAKTCQCKETKRQFLWSILLSTIEMTSKSSKHICSETTRLQLVGSLEFNYSTSLLWSVSPLFSCIEPNPPIKRMKRSRGLSQFKSGRAAHMGISTEERLRFKRWTLHVPNVIHKLLWQPSPQARVTGDEAHATKFSSSERPLGTRQLLGFIFTDNHVNRNV